MGILIGLEELILWTSGELGTVGVDLGSRSRLPGVGLWSPVLRGGRDPEEPTKVTHGRDCTSREDRGPPISFLSLRLYMTQGRHSILDVINESV